MPPPDLSSYILSPAASSEIFNNQILPAELTDIIPSSLVLGQPSYPPLAVLIVGQTGAGKTRLAPAVLSAFRALRGTPAHFIADTYKTYHPAYASLTSDPETAALASPATGPDARRWLLMAVSHAASLRLDVLLESACRHPEDFVQLAAAFHQAGYRIEVLLLAVPYALSRLGILTRYYEKLPEAGSRGLPVRLTPMKVHNDSYAGLLSAAEWIDANSDKVDQVLVVRRGNAVAFSDVKLKPEGEDGSDANGSITLSGHVADSVRLERMRPLTNFEKATAMADTDKLDLIDRQQADEMRDMLEPLMVADYQTVQFSELLPLAFPPGGPDMRATLRLGCEW